MKLSYWGYLTPVGGYGIANLNWCKHLIRQGVDLYINAKFIPTEGTMEWNFLNEEERSMFQKPYETQRIGIIETTPENFDLLDTEIKICNTMAETDEIGEKWVNKINQMDYVIVPNTFYKEVFAKSGVSKPITVIPHGVDGDRFKLLDRGFKNRSVYRFGSCGYLNNRKGVFELIQAFNSEFDENENVELHLHSTDPELGWYKNIKDKRIKITADLWSFDKLVNWYHKLDCFVFPSKAEGIGYPPREAMATGLPVILMNYSGLEDIAHYSFPIHPAGFEKVNPVLEQTGNWAKIDIQELMGVMRYVYENQDVANFMGIKAAQFIRDEFSWESSTNKLLEFLNELSGV